MGNEPFVIDGVPGESAAQMIVYPALTHLRQCQHHGLSEGLGPRPLPGAPEQLQDGGLWKLGRLADAAFKGVELSDHLFGDAGNALQSDNVASVAFGELAERRLQGLDVLAHLVGFVSVGFPDTLQYLRESWSPEAGSRRKVGPAPKGFSGGREEHRQGPTAMLAQKREGRLIDGINIGALLPVDLDVDELAVHERRNFRVLEALVSHHMTPVACGVSDRKEDRLFLVASRREGFLVPRVPVHRIVLVLQQVGTGLGRQPVAVGRRGFILHGDRCSCPTGCDWCRGLGKPWHLS